MRDSNSERSSCNRRSLKHRIDDNVGQMTNDDPRIASELLVLSRQYVDVLRNADRQAAIDLVLRAADEHSVEDIYTGLLQEAQYEVGRLWEANEISVAQEHYST